MSCQSPLSVQMSSQQLICEQAQQRREDGSHLTSYLCEEGAFVVPAALANKMARLCEVEDEVVRLRTQLEAQTQCSAAAELRQLQQEEELQRHRELRESDRAQQEQLLSRRNSCVQELQRQCQELQTQCRLRNPRKLRPKQRAHELTAPEAQKAVKALADSWDALLDCCLPDGQEPIFFSTLLDAAFWRHLLAILHDDKFRACSEQMRRQIRNVFSAVSAEKEMREGNERRKSRK